MEKRCEFCKALSPVVYCSSDAAHLCLSCDAKVHSANALSFRHPRTLVCESCKYRPSHVRCIDHEMFMCQTCDSTHHLALHHRRSVVSCYIGCPSAKELAELWGLDLKESDGRCIESEGGSSRLGTTHKCSLLILQQILDLEMLQEGIDSPCLLHIKERTGGLPFKHDTVWREHKMIDSHLDHSNGHLDFQNRNSPFIEKTDEPLSSPFPQLDNLTNTGNTSNGDSFWQYKSPLHNNEIWLENMQDIGVCDEIRCFDDVNIPDVDLTFRNFEELFDSEKETVRSVVDDDNMECSFADNHPSFGKLDRCFTSTIEDAKKEIDTCNNLHQSQSNHDRPIRPSYSASSLSVSRITGESSGSEYKDDGLYPTFSQHNIENTNLNGKQKATTRYKEKKVLRHEKEADFTSPGPISGFNKRAKSRALKVEGLKRDEDNVTRNF